MNENDPGAAPLENPAPEQQPSSAAVELPSEIQEPAPQPGMETAIISISAPQDAGGTEQPAAAPPPPGGFWVRPGWLALALVGLASSLLAVALTLGILGLTNRGLSYASPADILLLQSQVGTLQAQTDSLTQDLTGLGARVDQLEELAARTTQLEKMALELQGEIDKRVAQAESLQDKVEDVQTKIAEVVTQSKAFESFVAGLRDLLNFFPKEEMP